MKKPSTDETAGMKWWNAMVEEDRAYWLREAGSAVVADAWALFKRRTGYCESSPDRDNQNGTR